MTKHVFTILIQNEFATAIPILMKFCVIWVYWELVHRVLWWDISDNFQKYPNVKGILKF